MLRIFNQITPDTITIGVLLNERILVGVAQCSTIISGDEMYFNRLFVRPNFRNKGLGTRLLQRLLQVIKERQIILQLDINPYGDMNYEELENFYTKYGFKKYLIDGNFYTYYFNKEVTEMDINNFNVEKKNIATIITEQTFLIGDNADIEVVVNLYEHEGEYKMTSWLNGIEELNTIEYEGSLDSHTEILAAMEKLVNDNEDYILDIADGD